MKSISAFVVGKLVLLISSCSRAVGPRAMVRDRTQYSASLSDFWKDQTLLNIVKLRYADNLCRHRQHCVAANGLTVLTVGMNYPTSNLSNSWKSAAPSCSRAQSPSTARPSRNAYEDGFSWDWSGRWSEGLSRVSFENQKALAQFLDSGASDSALTDATAKAGEKGGARSGAAEVEPGVWVYRITDNGLALQLTHQGRKYYKDDDLDKKCERKDCK